MGLPLIDRLEVRRLFIGGTDGPGSDPTAILDNGVLTITDTDDGHGITLTTTTAGNIEISIKDITQTVIFSQSFKAGDVDLTWIEANAGDDFINIVNQTAFAGRIYINAGYGKDHID